MLKTQAWKISNERGVDKCIYRIQISGIKGVREENKINKYMKGWKEAGIGYNNKKEETILFFNKDFHNTSKWITWAKIFPFSTIDELNEDGDVKNYLRLGNKNNGSALDFKPPTCYDGKGKGKRRCGLCGEYDHNSRTCKANIKQEKEKTPQNKKVRSVVCSKCGKTGHNKRTCKF